MTDAKKSPNPFIRMAAEAKAKDAEAKRANIEKLGAHGMPATGPAKKAVLTPVYGKGNIMRKAGRGR